ncbi:MAG TPA: glutamyl-tRNA reductase [Gemmataceae bacterium]
MNLLLVGCSHRTAPVAVRERLTVPEPRVGPTLAELLARFGGEALVLSTCNRLEVYLAPDAAADAAAVGTCLAELHGLDPAAVRPHLYERRDADAVRHVFRVAASLDSLVVGEGQIAGQVKRAYELAMQAAAAGPVLHALFQHARVVAKRVRRETGIARGHASVSSVAVDYVRQVFAHFRDKTVLVIGAGKMGGLTLKHLAGLRPQRILVTNRSPDKAADVAAGCGGEPVPWDKLDDVLAAADIVLSTTGAAEPIVTRKRFAGVLARRTGGPMVILDIAVPRDFDPAIHDGDRVCLFNIDDLQRIRERTLADRLRHVGPAEAIVEQEAARFVAEWARRRNGPIIAQLTEDFDRKRRAVVAQLLGKLNGRLSDTDKKTVEGAFRLLQNQFLHGPISALGEASHEGGGSALLEALRQLFRLGG